MTNVVKFPKGKGSAPEFNLDAEKIKSAMPKVSTIKGVLFWVWFAVRLPVFLVLYWLRFPVMFLCNIISIPMMLAWLFAWYAFPDKTTMVWGFATVSLLAFVIGWTYDFILMAISPQDMMKTI